MPADTVAYLVTAKNQILAALAATEIATEVALDLHIVSALAGFH